MGRAVVGHHLSMLHVLFDFSSDRLCESLAAKPGLVLTLCGSLVAFFDDDDLIGVDAP
jgi:hypothetical protein